MRTSNLVLAFVILCSTSLRTHAQDKPLAVTLDVTAAQAVLFAVADPQLTRAEATRIAELAGNQGLVRKENSYGRPAKTADLADALLAVAHGQTEPAAFHFNFSNVKANAPALSALVHRIETHPAEFHDWVVQRVAAFSPSSSHMVLSGYLVTGGTSGGFAFDEPAFYLNLNYFSDFETAKVVLSHELYHAVQAVYADKSKPWWSQPPAKKNPDAVLAQQCSSNADLFDALYQEGSASYVGDEMLLEGVDSPDAKKTFTEFQYGLGQLHRDATLLELSVTGLNAPQPVPFDAVYSVDFYVPEPLYKLGYAMIKALDNDSGRAAVIALLPLPGYRFADAYVRLPNYGKDYDHPKLEANTIAAIQRLAAGCPQSSASTKH
jgi:hypothetical protein